MAFKTKDVRAFAWPNQYGWLLHTILEIKESDEMNALAGVNYIWDIWNRSPVAYQ